MSRTTDFSSEILVIGAGLTGLTAAMTLKERGINNLLILEKMSKIGGRLLTRTFGEGGRADLGAQFFTVRTQKFQKEVSNWIRNNIVFQWSDGWNNGKLNKNSVDGFPRYAANNGMESLAQHLSLDLNIKTNVEILALSKVKDKWVATDNEKNNYVSNHVILTLPVPLSLKILQTGSVDLNTDVLEPLKLINYDRTLCGIFSLEGKINLPPPGVLQRHSSDYPWIASNYEKGISEIEIITIHGSKKFSLSYWEDSTIALDLFENELKKYFFPKTTVITRKLKKWRYSSPINVFPERYILANYYPSLLFAGDAFGGPRVEGAFLSGMSCAGKLLSMI